MYGGAVRRGVEPERAMRSFCDPRLSRFGGLMFLYVGAALAMVTALVLTATPSSAIVPRAHTPGALSSPLRGEADRHRPVAPPPSPTAAPRVTDPAATLLGTAALPLSAQVAPPPGAEPVGVAFGGVPQIGAVFGYGNGTLTDHFCSGSVVASPAGDLVVTAAHCVYGDGSYTTDIAYVPGYHDGQEPYGVWLVSKIYVAPQWMADADPDDDFAFLTVYQPGRSTPIQQVTGADQLDFSPSYTALTEVIGYPDGTEEPVACTNYTTEFSPTQIQFDCAGYPAGTSGGPFLTQSGQAGSVPTVYGVIGGYQTGGDTANVSYTAYFGAAAQSLYAQATATPF